MKWVQTWIALLIILVLVISCHTTKKMGPTMLPAFDLEGHRGCRGLMPENTIPAMLRAIDMGVTTLEMDVVITADKKVILSHEPFFNHEITTRPGGGEVSVAEEKELNIYRMTYAETQRFDVGIKPHPRFPQQEKIKAIKPLLDDIIEDVEAYIRLKGVKPVFYNIETKLMTSTDSIFHPVPEEFVKLLVEVIAKKRITDRVIIQSFDYRTLKIIHQQFPQIKTAALVEDFDKQSVQDLVKELGFVPTIYSPHYSLVNETRLRECHALQMKVIPWTVNDKATFDKLKSMGVDGIITDYPNLAR